jgi:hypothetical protein
MADHDTDSALLELGAPDTGIDQRRSALSRLLAAKSFQKNAATPAVQAALDIWSGLAAQSSARDLVGLLAVSELVRMGASAPVISGRVSELLEKALAEELPPVDLAAEADVRFNVARAVKAVMPAWAAGYAAHGMASEEKGDKARAEFAAVLVDARPGFGESLQVLRDAFSEISYPTDDPAKVAARRGAKALEELRKALLAKGLAPGDDFGAVLDSFVRALIPEARLKDDAVASEFALQVIALVQVAVRSRFSVATMPDSFLAVRRVRRLFPGDRWPPGLRGALNPLAADIKEAIVILAKQGVASSELLRQLEIVLGSRDAAKEETAGIAAGIADIPEEVKFFLVHWRARLDLPPSGQGVSEAALQQLDSVVAEALRFDAQTRLDPAKLVYVEESVASFDPIAFATIEALSSREDGFQRALVEIAKRRRLSLHGMVGEEMSASAKYFSSKSGASKGIVILPAVVRLRPDGSPGPCILRGQLE